MPSLGARPEPTRRASLWRGLEIPAVFVTFLTLGGFNALKCFPGVLDIGYLPYWYVSLARGFTRRSLLGTFASPFMEGLSAPDALIRAGIICAIAGLALLIAMSLGVCAVYERQPNWPAKLLWLLVAAVGFAAPILPIVAIAVSALDQFLLLGVLGITVAVLGGRWFLALALALLVPLIHEGFLFLALPPLFWICLRRPAERTLSIACMGCIVVLTVLLMTCTAKVTAFPASAPLPPATIEMFERYQLAQTASGSFLERWNEFRSEWRRYSLAAGLSAIPILVMIGLTLPRVPGPRRFAVAAVLGLGAGFSMSIMLAAWDLWRFFAWGDATALLLCGLEFQAGWPCQESWLTRRPARLAALSAIVLVPATASLDAPTYVWGTNMVGLVDKRAAPLVPALARWGERFGDFYNRLAPSHDRERLDVFRWLYNRPHPSPADMARLCGAGRICDVNYRMEESGGAN